MAFAAFVVSSVLLVVGGAFVFGVVAHWKNWQPVPLMNSFYDRVKELVVGDWVLISDDVRYADPVSTLSPERVAPGLVLVAGDQEPRKTRVRIMDRGGRTIHEWRVEWQDIWAPDEGSFPLGRRPVRDMYLHGVSILPDGDIVANFEHASTVRMNICGEVVWKLDNLGHHSVEYDGEDAVWVAAETFIEQGDTGFDHHDAPLRSWTLQKIGLDGVVLRTIPVIEILEANNLEGLLFLSSLEHNGIRVTGDTLHLNDVEAFPRHLPPGFFEPGDLAFSLRNVNTVMVIDGETLEAKMVSTGRVLRQHDVDFISGRELSVFDNRNPAPRGQPKASRIVEIDAPTGAVSVALDGSGPDGFHTGIMGAHQRLSNGNILVTDSGHGRVLEYTSDGDLVWRYSNRWKADKNLRVYASKILPEDMDEAFFKERKTDCANL